ncbi:wax ester/triacylglycerol synthase domain-containing protein [Rhodococcus sp. Eu-32]|uniref:wax ester/triacylglycerol synthase domain-containing protein n=1 Tax=Rhodococcus sp. Eu-32 TaxID=1017319 RepID=UPI001403D319|nr:wax ester/triacylglycerol synthase domain-containing protein [Rhodococcus sp. Eu-32]
MSRLDLLDAAFHFAAARNGSRDHYTMYVFDSPPDGAPETGAIVDYVRVRARDIPELNRRIAHVPLNLDLPHWVHDDRPVESRVVLHDLTGGTWTDFENLLGRLKETPLDAATQAWRLHIVHGLTEAPRTVGSPTVVVLQITHALTAGVGAGQLGRALFGPTGQALSLPGHGRPTDIGTLALRAVGAAFALPARTASYLVRASKTRRAYRDSNPDTSADRARPVVRGNDDPTHRRAVHVLTFDADSFRRRGLSLTTLGLTALGLASERFLAEFGETIPSTFNARVPIAMPDDVDWSAANRVVTAGVELFVDEPDLRRRAEAIRGSLALARERANDAALLRWARAENCVPAPLFLAAQRRRQARLRPTGTTVRANTIMVSVNHGPRDLELCGARAVFSGDFPMLSDGHSVTHGFYGLGDAVSVCVVACPDTFPDHERYAEILADAVADVADATS